MKFRDLKVYDRFEFDHSALPNGGLCSGLEPGPWRKISARKYRKDTSPFSGDAIARMDHAIYNAMICTVGSINVAVIPLD